MSSCLDETEFPEKTREVFNAYLDRVRTPHSHVYGLENSVAVLAEKATFRFLDGIFLDPDLTDDHRRMVFMEVFDRKNPLSGVCAEKLLDWCRQGDNFQARLVMISEAIHPFDKRPNGEEVVLSEQTRTIIDAAQDPSTVLRHLYSSVCPMAWSGSRAKIIAERRQAFEMLLKHERSDIRAGALTHIAELRRREKEERHDEQARDRQREQRFE